MNNIYNGKLFVLLQELYSIIIRIKHMCNALKSNTL